jgi:DNA-binding transcriptional LysR family regulator
MELRQLEYVVAVADTGGFTRAARSVHVAQPSLSHGVRSLEAELGIEIFARLGRTVAPTPAGEAIIASARRVLSAMAEVRTSAAAALGLLEGRLDLVALPTLAVDPVATLIGRFRADHPAVAVRLVEPEDAETLEAQVRSGRAEVGFSDITLGGAGLQRVSLYRQELVAVCPPGRAEHLDSLTPTDLAAMPLIATPPGTSTRRLLDLVLAKTSHPAEIAVELNQREAILPLVLAGAGATLLPTTMAAQARERGAVVRPMRPTVSRPLGLVHRAGELSPAAAAFVALARRDAATRR